MACISQKNDPKVEPCLDPATDSKIARLEIRDAGSDESRPSLGGGWKIDGPRGYWDGLKPPENPILSKGQYGTFGCCVL